MEGPQPASFTDVMTHTRPVRITLRLPRDIAQDVIVRHATSAREWQQLPFDALKPPVEIEGLDDSRETTDLISRMLPRLLDSILQLVGDQGWSARYDKQSAVSVAGAICAYAFESGVRLPLGPASATHRRVAKLPPMPMWLN
jgi:hypothetical protein